MAGVNYQSADLLALFNSYAGRPASDSITDPTKYQYLTYSQDRVLAIIASISPAQQAPVIAALTTADGGKTFTFGTDGEGYAAFPMGGRIYPTTTAIPDYPWTPGVDYLDEGTQIRMPNNLTWTAGLYWYGVLPVAAITGTIQPSLQPPPARLLIVIDAVRSFAEQFVRDDALVNRMDIKWQREFGPMMTMIRKHLRGNRNRSIFGWAAGVGIGRPGLTS